MVFKIQHSVPAYTTKTSPDWQKLPIMKGVIRQWVLFQPDECANVMQFRVEYHGHPVLPATGDEWMYGFFIPTPFIDKLKIDDAPYVLDIYAFNDDDTYSHEYNIYIVVDPPKAISPVKISEKVPAAWKKIFGGGD